MSISELKLALDELESLSNLASMLTANPSETPDMFCHQAKTLARRIPQRILTTFQEFALHGSPTGFLLIQTAPIDDARLPNTPPDNKHHVGETTELAKIQALCMSAIGDMIAYEAEGHGHLFQDIVPTKSLAQKQTSMGSVELEIHTEQAFSTLRPDLLSLCCLRGDPEAHTYIMPVKSICNNLSNYEQDLLHEPLWTIGVDLSFKLHGHEFMEGDVRGPISILHGSYQDPQLVFDQDLMKGTNEKSTTLIQNIVDIYYKERFTHTFVPGDIVIVDNRRAVHGRSTFHPKYDGKDRFLVRCFGILDYERTKYARPNDARVIASVYS